MLLVNRARTPGSLNRLAASRPGPGLEVVHSRVRMLHALGGKSMSHSLLASLAAHRQSLTSSRTGPVTQAASSSSSNSMSVGRSGNSLFVTSLRSGGGGGGGGNHGSGGSGKGSGGSGDGAAHPMRLWTFIFAFALAAGGAAAYIRKGSGKSLGASLSASVILALCAKSMVGASAPGAARVAFGLTLLLGIAMVNRFTKTRKVMPAGLVAGSSLLMSASYLLTGL